MTETISKYSKKAIFIISDKGGCGKSTITSCIFEYLQERNVKFKAFDCDSQVSHLINVYGSTGLVDQLNIRSERHKGGIVNAMATNADILLFDLPAGSVAELINLVADNPSLFIKFMLSKGIEPIFINPITPMSRSILSVKTLLDLVDGRAKVHVVKNLSICDADEFPFFDDDDRKLADFASMMAVNGGQVIHMPRLHPWMYAQVDHDGLSYSAAIVEYFSGESLWYAGTCVQAWKIKFDEEIDKLNLVEYEEEKEEEFAE